MFKFKVNISIRLEVIILALAAMFMYSPEGNTQNTYVQTLVAPNVEVQYLRGQMRFCERENLRGIVCGFQQNLFGKKRFAARDWWSPETYVQARTGLNEFTLYKVEPTADNRGLVIYFSP